MSGIREFRVRWDGVAGAPYWSTFRQTAVGTLSAQAFGNEVLAFLGDVAGNMTNAIAATLLNDVPVIESTTGQLIGAETIDGDEVIGSQTGEALPRTTQGLVQWFTGQVIAGRRLRGRMFLPGFTETQNAPGGVPASALVVGMNTAITDFITAVSPDFVIYSRTHFSGASVTSGTLWTEWASLRSRRD